MTIKPLCCSQDFEIDFVLTAKAAATGIPGAVTGVVDLTAHLSATKGGAAINVALEVTLQERSAAPGSYFSVIERSALTAHLIPTYERQRVWLVITRPNDIDAHSFPYLVAAQCGG